MNDISGFLKQCEALTSGQSLAEIIHKAIVLIDDPSYWCGQHRACIREHLNTQSGLPYIVEMQCRINDPRATCVNIEGAVARACNNLGVLPPFLIRYLDEAALAYLNTRGIGAFGTEPSIWNEYDVGWFGQQYGHEHAVNLLHEIYARVS
jgi:hypothetical protein